MQVTAVTTADGSLLRAIRGSLATADEALMCVAFASEQGVHLLGREFKRLGGRTRLLVTTTFGTTTPAALGMARAQRVDVRLLNPGAGQSYHPKVYLTRRSGGRATAIIGSANLTGGLVSNVEAAAVLEGDADEPELAKTWTWAEGLWSDHRAAHWTVGVAAEPQCTVFDSDLLAMLETAIATDTHVHTLGRDPRANVVSNLTPTGLYVQTMRSRSRGTGPQFIPAWMFSLAWDYLRARGELTNRFLLDELHVHRSSAVCAILARLPPVEVVSTDPIALRWRADEEGDGDPRSPHP